MQKEKRSISYASIVFIHIEKYDNSDFTYYYSLRKRICGQIYNLVKVSTNSPEEFRRCSKVESIVVDQRRYQVFQSDDNRPIKG